MIQIVVALLIVAAGVGIAYVVRRRDAGTFAKGERWSVPAQLERTDFEDPRAERLVVVFSSQTCDACATTWERVQDIAEEGTALQQISYQDRQDLHDRYGIDAVPTLVVADAEGVVLRSFVGPPSVTELTEALAAEG